jgi:two-component system, LytTR family, response regulator
MKIRTIIIDDEDLATDLIERLLLGNEIIDVIGKYNSAVDALNAIELLKPDLIFSDIQMPKLTGIMLVEQLSYKPLVIFTTAFNEFALDAFNLNILDYVVKPISMERFNIAVEKAVLQFKMLHYYKLSSKNEKHFVIKKNGIENQIMFSDITHIEGLKQYAIIHTNKERYYLNETLKNIEQQLVDFNFVRIHKSFIVNKNILDKITFAHVVIGSIKIPIGRSYTSKL